MATHPESDPNAELESLPPKCARFAPGHTTHWIQTKVSYRYEPVPAQILEVSGHFITLMTANDMQTYWHHNPVRLAAIYDIAQAFPDDVKWVPDLHLLVGYRGQSGLAANLARLEQMKPCIQQPFASDSHRNNTSEIQSTQPPAP